jgi:hypothetical protein
MIATIVREVAFMPRSCGARYRGDRRRFNVLKRFAFFIGLAALTSAAEAQQQPLAAECSAGNLGRVAELREASGVAVSKRSPGRLYAHNDSGEAALQVLDGEGRTLGKLTIGGAKVEDWEAIAVGPCGSRSCIYIGDIGDNDARRESITIYRLPEPDAPSGAAAVSDVFHVRYPDGPQDAETLLVTASGELLIVSKGETAPPGIYRLPRDAKPGATVTLEQVARPPAAAKLPADERITDGAISPSGEWVALRTLRHVTFYRTDELLGGAWRAVRRVPLDQLREPQGEGIAFADESTLYLVGEGKGKDDSGTFGRLTCAP